MHGFFPNRLLKPRALTGWALTLMILASTVGCGGSGTPTSVPPTPTVSPVEILRRASAQLAATQTVHFELTVEGKTFVDADKKIELLSASGDLERPDRVFTTFKAKALGAATVTIKLITVGDQSWTTNILTGRWGAAPPEFAYQPTILFDNQQGIGPVLGRVEGATELTDDSVNGRQTYHIKADVDETVIGPLTMETMTGSPVTLDMWVDRETDDLLRARLAEPPGADRDQPATWTLNLSKHGEKVAIEPPI